MLSRRHPALLSLHGMKSSRTEVLLSFHFMRRRPKIIDYRKHGTILSSELDSIYMDAFIGRTPCFNFPGKWGGKCVNKLPFQVLYCLFTTDNATRDYVSMLSVLMKEYGSALECIKCDCSGMDKSRTANHTPYEFIRWNMFTSNSL